MSIREEQCNKVCRILDDVLANRTTERDSLIVAVRKAFESLEQFGNSEPLPSAQPYTEAEIQKMQELEQAQLDKAYELGRQSVQPEPLTDKEQRIFLAAMGREEKVCEEVDRNCVREPYEDSLMRVCKEIRRKVKGALWTI